MEPEAVVNQKFNDKRMKSFYSQSYYFLRIFLHKNRWLLRFTQILRALIILGPFREQIVRYFQKFGNNKPLPVSELVLFSNLDVDEAVRNINAKGFSDGEKLSEEYVDKIIEFSNKINAMKIMNPHKDCKVIDELSRNEKIMQVVRRYLGAEPRLWLTELRWTLPKLENPVELPSIYEEIIQHDACAFHYDSLDCKSLTVFIYLTDVDVDSGPHVHIEGTQNKSMKDLMNLIISDSNAQKKYGRRIKTVLGKAGTVFFEDTSIYHKVATSQKARLLLMIDYVLQRSIPPERPILKQPH